MIIGAIKKLSEAIGDEWNQQIETCEISYKKRCAQSPKDTEPAESEISEAEIRLLEKILPGLLADLPPPSDMLV
ncbi:MAG: hypothetical protein Q8M99_11360 [Methylotenera sp.]|nr:hypothetical protein [Methylotenera sp.]